MFKMANCSTVQQAFIFFNFLCIAFCCKQCEEPPAHCAAFTSSGDNLVDLTHPLTESSLVLPEMGGNLKLNPLSVPPGLPFYLEYNRFEVAEHTGTHLDAPRHFYENGVPVGRVPVKDLMGRGAMVDLAVNGVPVEGDYMITVKDLEDWENKHGALSDDQTVLLFRTGLGPFYTSDPNRYLGTNSNMTEFHFPGVGPTLAQHLVDNTNVKVVGIDTMSMDIGASPDHMSHLILLANGITLIENVANLERLQDSPSSFHAVVMPIKLDGGSGGPCRVVAIKDVN